MIYYFYITTDKTKEAVNQVEAASLDIALDYFSKVKNLNKDEFLEIYTIGIKNK